MISLLRNALLVVLLGMQNMPPMPLTKQFIMTKTKINFIWFMAHCQEDCGF